MAVTGNIQGEKNNFLYNAKKNSLIYLYAESISVDEKGNCYIALDSIFRDSFKKIVSEYSSEYKQVYVPVTILDEDFTEDSMILHFNLINYPTILETVSRFEAKEMQEDDYYIIFTDVNVKFSNKINFLQKSKDNFNKEKRRILQKKHYETLLQKEYELQGLALGESGNYDAAVRLRGKSDKLKRKMKKYLAKIDINGSN